MDRVVLKFGGSNLKTPSDIRRSAAVVAAYESTPVVVVSAFSGVTDRILSSLEEAVLFPEHARKLVEELVKQHHRAAQTQLEEGTELRQLLTELDELCERLRKLLVGIHYIGAVPDFTRDQALSYGERLSSRVLTAVLRSRGLEALERDPEAIGLYTDGIFGTATVDVSRCAAGVREALAGNHIFVVPGFYGITEAGKTTVFGRGGSDYSAAIIARCIDAVSLDLWKDVDGFLSCDPRLVSDSRTIPKLSYAEAAELSYFGAKILHPRTVEPLEEAGIPIRVMNVERFSGSIEPFTIVGPEAPAEDRPESDLPVKSVASTEDIAVLRLEGPGVGSRPGILARATGRLDASGVNICSVITAQTCINLLVKRGDLQPALAAVKAESVPGVVYVEGMDDLAIVAAVGSGIRDGIGVGARILGALKEEGINVVLAQAGASPVAVYILLRRADRESAVRAIHTHVGRQRDGKR